VMQASAISRTGLDVEWQRLQVIAQNLANMNTTGTASGAPFRPSRLLSGPRADFAGMLGHGDGQAAPQGVEVTGLETLPGNVRRVYEPGHPHADPQGFVTYPDLDLAGEMTLMIRTSRSYEANLVALGIAHQMYQRALDLGRQS
jgi:flagellar basal-body rod protein FlgC